MSGTHRSGYVAIVGRPNAGKSTLLNAILGTKLAIATHKAQTTRHRILGIHSDDDSQICFLDTPGVIEPRYRLQEVMMGTVRAATADADLILHLVDVRYPDDAVPVRDTLLNAGKAVILGLNKTDAAEPDTIARAETRLTDGARYAAVHRLSARTGEGVPELLALLKTRLLPGPAFYPKDQLSEHPERFFVAELVREQIFLQYQEEIPYSCAVEILEYKEGEDIDHIMADIIVARDSQKGILIGKKGSALKKLGTAARAQIEAFIDKRVHLQLFVKVRDNWRDKDAHLRGFGYME